MFILSIERLESKYIDQGLIELSFEFFDEYRELHPDFYDHEIDETQIKEYFNSFISSEDKISYIAVDDGRPIAYITAYIKEQAPFYRIQHIGEISGLMVKNDYRRQGLATQLLRRVETFFRDKSVKYYTLFTAVENGVALDFYRSQGLQNHQTILIGTIEGNSG